MGSGRWTGSCGVVGDRSSVFRAVTTENHAQPGTSATEWIKTYTDGLGRTLAVEYPDGALQTSQYNAKDRLEKQTDPDGVVALFGNNALNELEIQALDMNRNGVIDYTGSDRISRNHRDVADAHGTTVSRTTTSVWATNVSVASGAS